MDVRESIFERGVSGLAKCVMHNTARAYCQSSQLDTRAFNWLTIGKQRRLIIIHCQTNFERRETVMKWTCTTWTHSRKQLHLLWRRPLWKTVILASQDSSLTLEGVNRFECGQSAAVHSLTTSHHFDDAHRYHWPLDNKQCTQWMLDNTLQVNPIIHQQRLISLSVCAKQSLFCVLLWSNCLVYNWPLITIKIIWNLLLCEMTSLWKNRNFFSFLLSLVHW